MIYPFTAKLRRDFYKSARFRMPRTLGPFSAIARNSLDEALVFPNDVSDHIEPFTGEQS
jgi:hypothetical protein